jgi:EpsD family peptidyl-prolyl cis-trans isomerase
MARAAGVLILLGAIGACSDQEKTNSKVLVTVNGDDITARQLEAELWSAAAVADNAGAARQPAVRRQALEALIDRQVLLDEALRNKIDRDPKVIQIADRLKTQAIVQAYLESKASNLANASQQEIDAYYNAHPELFAQRKVFDVTQLTVAAKDFGRPLKAVMDQARSLEQVALWLRQHRIDYVRTQRSYTSADLPPQMAGKLQGLQRNSLFVMQDKDGGQDELCVLTDLRGSPVSRAAATAQIERYLLNKKMQEVAAAEVARLRASAKLVYAEPASALMVEEDGGKTVAAGVAAAR